MTIDPGAFQPLPIRDERTAAARAEAEKLLAEANRMHREAGDKAQRIVGDARAEADRIRAAAAAEQAERQKKDDNLDAWAARAIIAGTVGLTASGEYALARMVGFDAKVAWLLPFVIDVYVIQAFRRHRDIVQAITLTIAANVAYHLADARLFGLTPTATPTWWLIAMVASVASLVLWRVHLMTAPSKPPRERRKRRQNTPAPAANSNRQERPSALTDQPTTVAAKTAPPVDKSERQDALPVDDKKRQDVPVKKAPTGARKAAPTSRQKPAKKAPARRSMDEWVDLTEPVFHAEFKRLKRNPTASEFATAIGEAGHGQPSDSTAKNIRTEILDRAELPSLDGTE